MIDFESTDLGVKEGILKEIQYEPIKSRNHDGIRQKEARVICEEIIRLGNDLIERNNGYDIPLTCIDGRCKKSKLEE